MPAGRLRVTLDPMAIQGGIMLRLRGYFYRFSLLACLVLAAGAGKKWS